MGFARFWAALRRCKHLEADPTATPLARVLNLLDLTLLGIGSTLGLGVYVLAGSVAKTVAGPAVILSFAVAGIASGFAGLCYAEFAARVPKAGSSYVYSYVSVGEFLAFTIGWNLILEYVLSTASMAKGLSNYIDKMLNGVMSKAMLEIAPMNVSFLAKYPDFFAFILVCAVTVLLALGVKDSSRMTNLLTTVNLLTIMTLICAGAPKCDPANWRIAESDIAAEYKDKRCYQPKLEADGMAWRNTKVVSMGLTEEEEEFEPKYLVKLYRFQDDTGYFAGTGGFMPWGFPGVMAGAARCFFGYVGFDCLATTGEEAKNPTRNIPCAIIISLVVIFLAYFSSAIVLTLMWPYYLQDADAPLIHVFQELGMPVVKWVVSCGAITALCTNLIGSFFPLPRVLYAMAVDGLVCRPMGRVNHRTKTPVHATLLGGLLAGLLAMVFDLDQLVDMLSIGTLLAYTIVATSVLVLRYEASASEGAAEPLKPTPRCAALVQAFNCRRIKQPTNLSSNIAKVTCVLIFVTSLVFGVVLTYQRSAPAVGTVGALMVLLLLVLCRQPKAQAKGIYFAVPLVPLVPYLSVFINMYLIAQLAWETWVRFLAWMIVGYIIYFSYGIRKSALNVAPESQLTTSRR